MPAVAADDAIWTDCRCPLSAWVLAAALCVFCLMQSALASKQHHDVAHMSRGGAGDHTHLDSVRRTLQSRAGSDNHPSPSQRKREKEKAKKGKEEEKSRKAPKRWGKTRAQARCETAVSVEVSNSNSTAVEDFADMSAHPHVIESFCNLHSASVCHNIQAALFV